MKKAIKVNFVDFYQGFNKKCNEFLDILTKHYEVEISEKPEYLFYSCFGDKHLKYDCVKIFFTGECITPDFNECDYAIGFDRLEFADRYIRIPLYKMFQYKREFLTLFDRRPFTREDLNNKSAFCSFVYSNCFAAQEREEFFKKLSEYKTVFSGGRYMNNVGGPVKDKTAFQSRHKFSIAFENTTYPGYITEKIMESFVARTIPIYYGAPDVVKDFNNEAFINCNNYSSFDAVIQRVIEIDNNDDLYLEIINKPIVNSECNAYELERFLCHVINQDYKNAGRRPKSVTAQKRPNMIMRHYYFETYIYPPYAKICSGIKRLKKHAI